MNKIVYRKGDLFESIDSFKENVIIPHIVNIKNKMGAGFVVPLIKHFPEVKEDYHARCDNCINPKNLLGLTDFIVIEEGLTIANMFAQTLGGKRPLFYNALSQCMDEVAEEAYITDAIIVAPKFGAGLAGGQWDFIEALIEDCWLRRNIKVYVYEL